jgi:hypothetical protein
MVKETLVPKTVVLMGTVALSPGPEAVESEGTVTEKGLLNWQKARKKKGENIANWKKKKGENIAIGKNQKKKKKLVRCVPRS